MSLYIHETYVNRTRGYSFGDSGDDPHKAWTDDKGELFKSLRKEYGKCVSKVYIDQQGGPPKQVGWVFSKRMRYEDARDNSPESFYIREVWVTLHTEPPTRKVEYHYTDMK